MMEVNVRTTISNLEESKQRTTRIPARLLTNSIYLTCAASIKKYKMSQSTSQRAQVTPETPHSAIEPTQFKICQQPLRPERTTEAYQAGLHLPSRINKLMNHIRINDSISVTEEFLDLIAFKESLNQQQTAHLDYLKIPIVKFDKAIRAQDVRATIAENRKVQEVLERMEVWAAKSKVKWCELLEKACASQRGDGAECVRAMMEGQEDKLGVDLSVITKGMEFFKEKGLF